MKSTDHFKRTIKAYLDARASEDKLFAESYEKPHKNIDDCIQYILNTVKDSGCCGFTDGEIYSLAVHFWDEDDLTIGNPISCSVVVNHTVELTDEEKEEARQQAIKRVQDEAYARMKQSVRKPKPTATVSNQRNLFDL